MSRRPGLRNCNLDAVVHRPVPNLCAVNLQSVLAAHLACRKGVRIAPRAPVRTQDALQEPLGLVRPRRHVVAAGTARLPLVRLPGSPCREEGSPQLVEPRLAYAERLHCLLSGHGPIYELHHRVAHMRGTQPVCDLLLHGAYSTPFSAFAHYTGGRPPWGACDSSSSSTSPNVFRHNHSLKPA